MQPIFLKREYIGSCLSPCGLFSLYLNHGGGNDGFESFYSFSCWASCCPVDLYGIQKNKKRKRFEQSGNWSFLLGCRFSRCNPGI